MAREGIRIIRARVNNLQNVTLTIPRNKLVVITGLSGSGKSSLAFDVVYAEGSRRYLKGLSSYARQFLEVSGKPDVDKIENLSPTISIDQKSISRSPRSTVGTLTEIYDYLRILYAKVGVPYCPHCQLPMGRKSHQEILKELLALPDKTSVMILARVKPEQKSVHDILKSISQLGYARARIGEKVILIKDALLISEEKLNGNVEIVIDRIVLQSDKPDKERLIDSIETAFKVGKGFMAVCLNKTKTQIYNQDFVCSNCYFKISQITPKHFSFNSPEGACSHCSGLGVVQELDEKLVVMNKKLSLDEGAILPLAKIRGRLGKQDNYLEKLKKIGAQKGFTLREPLKNISADNLRIILYGWGKKTDKLFFEGVLSLINEKYKNTNSLSLRSEIEKYMLKKTCSACQGKRLKKEYLSVLVAGKSIDEIVNLDIDSFLLFWKEKKFNNKQKKIAQPLIKEMLLKAQALKNVGLEYLTIARGADSLSGGEGQRIRLATQLNSELSGVIYVLDEPTLGLHSRDTQKLIVTMRNLQKEGNSVLVVEHDREVIQKADWIIDMGPGAGEEGGKIIFEGDQKKLKVAHTSTAYFLKQEEKIVAPKNASSQKTDKNLEIIGAREHNLKNLTVKIPLEKLVVVTGVSGSGKSTLVTDILARALAKHFFRAKTLPGKHQKIKGLKFIKKVININQTPIGRTPRSNAATYTGIFSLIRELFANTEEAQKRKYGASRFSFNMKGGRCEDCQGGGTKKIEMHLLPDMYIQCETCQGTRYNQKTLDIEYQGVNIAQVLEMSVSYAHQFFKKTPLIAEKLKTLEEVGLGYLKLGQSATNLSGGEAQRIKLATELARKSMGKTLYILDEPTIGLHFEDVRKLLIVLKALVKKGNTVLVVEHNLDVVRQADWVIDLGPEGGVNGGELVYAGSVVGLKKCQHSWTGKYL